ncbi:hypothetical protein [Acetobacter sp.]|uniref:hypothetical protein n=1 Tax=Acetobacter sp. TaxID=440 RepID=UPI0039EC92B7
MTRTFPLTGFEHDVVLNLRDTDTILHTARMLSALVVEVTAKGLNPAREMAEHDALHWLSQRLQDQLDLLSAHTGQKDAPRYMMQEGVQA